MTQDSIIMSAVTSQGLEELYSALSRVINSLFVFVSVIIPYENGSLLTVCHDKGSVVREEFLDHGTYLEAYLPKSIASVLQDYQV